MPPPSSTPPPAEPQTGGGTETLQPDAAGSHQAHQAPPPPPPDHPPPLDQPPPLADHAARMPLVRAWVQQRVAGHDSSHDIFHIQRVAAAAARLAVEEGLTRDECQLAELAAWVHDSYDHKYSADPPADRQRLLDFLAREVGLSAAECETVLWVVDSMGFKEELGRRQAQQQAQQQQQMPAQQAQAQAQQQVPAPAVRRDRLLAVVQDADRLDAIGAIGIARCLTFGGRFGRVLHDPAVPPRRQLTKEQYADAGAAAQQTTLNHFDEKLLLLKDLMRTEAGRRLAEGRHAFMEAFLQRFHQEWQATD